MGRSGIEKFSLDQLANCGRVEVGSLRIAQARAISEAFGVEEGEVPPEFAELERELAR